MSVDPNVILITCAIVAGMSELSECLCRTWQVTCHVL